MSKTDNFAVSITHLACPICTQKANSQIVMNSILTRKHAKDVENLNGKFVGFADHACEECQKNIDNDFVALVGIEPLKEDATSAKPEDVTRTGLLWLKRHVFNDIFSNRELPQIPMVFVDEEIIQQITELTQPQQ